MKTAYTTGEAAKLCRVSQQTIIRCFDQGLIKGFKVPGSKFRRIPREALIEFMVANGIPTDVLMAPEKRVAQIDRELASLSEKQRALSEERAALSAAEATSEASEVVGPVKVANRIAGLTESA